MLLPVMVLLLESTNPMPPHLLFEKVLPVMMLSLEYPMSMPYQLFEMLLPVMVLLLEPFK